MSKKVTTSFKVNSKIREDFKFECFKNGVDMSYIIDFLMLDYILKSKGIVKYDIWVKELMNSIKDLYKGVE